MALSPLSSSHSDSDNDFESEEETNPYPLEGKYVDEDDREQYVTVAPDGYLRC